MDNSTVARDAYTKKIAEHPEVHVPLNSLQLEGNRPNFMSVSHEDFDIKNPQHHNLLIRGGEQTTKSNFELGDSSAKFSDRTMTHDEFGPKVGEKAQPLWTRRDAQMKIDSNGYLRITQWLYS